MNQRTRVRFAPSPTGPLHMGGVRTALYNYLYAKQNGGDFILRIEDTDSQRFVPGAEEYIIEALAWCGISPTEGVENGKIVELTSPNHPHAPYRQSQRREIYRDYAESLVNKGFAYYAFDTPEQLENLRKEAENKGDTFTYNHSVRNILETSLKLSASEVESIIQKTNNWVIRFKVPEDRIIKMSDKIRGEIEVSSNTLDDKVLWKAIDKLPTYHLANVVDDHLMEITDVIRGEEWLPSLPLHYLLYEAFEWVDTRPTFSHLSLLLKPDGKGKLSKRDGDRLGFPVFPLEWKAETGEISRGYREDGYYPEAFINMIAFLGWNPGNDKEIYTLKELEKEFSIERVIKSGAKFNPDKAKWYNQEYLRTKSTNELAENFSKTLENKGIKRNLVFIEKVIELVRERASFESEFWSLTSYLFETPKNFDQNVKAKYWKDSTTVILDQTYNLIKSIDVFTKEEIEKQLHQFIKGKELNMGLVMNTLRLCLVGESKGPSVADIMALIGKEESLLRIENGKMI